MQQAVPVGVGAMAAILGLEAAQVSEGLRGGGARSDLFSSEFQYARANGHRRAS